MHTYIKYHDTWIAGFFVGDTWRDIKSFGSEKEAAAYVNYLNGGDGKVLN